MINKKAMLLGNTLKLIVAVILLLGLFTATWMVYRAVTSDNELESATKLIDKVKAKIDALEPGQYTTVTIQGFDSVNWYINGWGVQDPSAPDQCFISSCVCICSGGFQKEDCDSRGVCHEVEEEEIKISQKSKVDVQYAGTFDTTLEYIKIPQNFAEVKIQKTTDSEGKTLLIIQDD
jgi:hypothetical protein